MSRLAAIIALALLAPAAHAQTPPRVYPEPDGSGEVVILEPQYQGVRAAAPIPPQLHIRNEGGSDGAGLCVYASMVMNGAFQRIADLLQLKDSTLWKYVKARPGGSYPDKLVRDVDGAYNGQVKVVSYYGKDASVLEEWTSQRYPTGATMGTARQYGHRPISHMISLLHFKAGGWACVLDNNFPGVYSWMPAAEFERRWKMTGGDGWAARWSGPPPAGPEGGESDPGEIWIVLLALAPAAILYLAKLTRAAPRFAA